MAFPSNTLVCDLVTKTQWGYRRNRFYFETDAVPTNIAGVEACANAVFTKYATPLSLMLTTQIDILRVEARFYGGGGSDFEANSTVAKVPGVNSAMTPPGGTDGQSGVPDTLPDEVSLIVQKRTGVQGREKRGRWFFTGLSEKVQNEGVVDEEARVMCKNFANVLSDDIDVDEDDLTTILHARHYDRKNNMLVPINKCYVIATMGSRIDRRRPLSLERL